MRLDRVERDVASNYHVRATVTFLFWDKREVIKELGNIIYLPMFSFTHTFMQSIIF